MGKLVIKQELVTSEKAENVVEHLPFANIVFYSQRKNCTRNRNNRCFPRES